MRISADLGRQGPGDRIYKLSHEKCDGDPVSHHEVAALINALAYNERLNRDRNPLYKNLFKPAILDALNDGENRVKWIDEQKITGKAISIMDLIEKNEHYLTWFKRHYSTQSIGIVCGMPIYPETTIRYVTYNRTNKCFLPIEPAVEWEAGNQKCVSICSICGCRNTHFAVPNVINCSNCNKDYSTWELKELYPCEWELQQQTKNARNPDATTE